MRVLLVVYDNSAYMHWFPQGLAYIASALRDAGHHVEVWSQDMHHWPDEHLTEHLDKDQNVFAPYDVVGLGICGGGLQYRKAISICQAVKAVKDPPMVILGGHGPAPEPEFFLRKTGADVVVIGEGEETIVEFLATPPNEKGSVEGIAYLDDAGELVETDRRPLVEDVDSIAWPAYDLFPMHYYRLMTRPKSLPTDFILPLLTGRGCPYRCTFCYRMDPGFRPRSDEAICDEIEFLQRVYGVTYFIFSDELLMSSEARTISLNEAFLSRGLKFRYYCSGRLNFATPEVLGYMRRGGCEFNNYGIESVDDEVLRMMKKQLTYEQIEAGVRYTIEAGISPGLNMLFGNFGDTWETLWKAVDFLCEYTDGTQLRTIKPVTPYPGTELYDLAIAESRLAGVEEFYEDLHRNPDLPAVQFSELDDDEFLSALYRANTVLIDKFYELDRGKALQRARQLYGEKDASFRGFRDV